MRKRKTRRRFTKRRTYGKRRFRKRRLRIPKYDEVKTYGGTLNSQALKISWPNPADDVMYAEAFIYNSILNNITQGLDYFNRIGNQIYVLSIKFKFNIWMCSANADELNTGIVRIIVGEPVGVSLASSFTGFFRTLGKDKTIQQLNRKKYNFPIDRSYMIASGYTNRLNANNDPLRYSGAMRHIELNIPLNRRVEYTQNGAVKNQKDQLSLFMTPYVPSGVTQQQVMCCNLSYSIYYVDA